MVKRGLAECVSRLAECVSTRGEVMPDKPRKAAVKLMRNDTRSDLSFGLVYSTGPATDRDIGGFHGNLQKENLYTKRGLVGKTKGVNGSGRG